MFNNFLFLKKKKFFFLKINLFFFKFFKKEKIFLLGNYNPLKFLKVNIKLSRHSQKTIGNSESNLTTFQKTCGANKGGINNINLYNYKTYGWLYFN